MKIGKASRAGNVFAEFLKNIGSMAKLWLREFYNNIPISGKIPNIKKSKILAILKHGKSSEDPASYRPIALFTMCYKLLEGLI